LTLLLTQLHKLVYVSQLPPKSSRDLKRTIISRYKHALFARGGAATGPGGAPAALIKQEMQQLVSGSRSLIPAAFELPHMDASTALLTSPSTGSVGGGSSSIGGVLSAASPSPSSSSAHGTHALTHEEMQLMIEQVLEEAGYYAQSAELHGGHGGFGAAGPGGGGHADGGLTGRDDLQR
jgi:NIMA (never in mitosis gene a)-related kinase